MLRSLLAAAAIGALASQNFYLLPSVRLPVYMMLSRSRQTGIAKARREKRQRRAKK
jgi:hypothetical protein